MLNKRQSKDFISFLLPITLLFLLPFVMSGCTQKIKQHKDNAPKRPPSNLNKIPDAVPKFEPLSKYGNRFKKSNTYVARKKRYQVLSTSKGYKAKGQASWYGTKFHGRKTSSGETYNMYAMTAAHRTLPLPTYARVTNCANGKSIIVKINDRGPFHKNRLIDLSYAAAHKLAIVGTGTSQVIVESVDPRDHNGFVHKKKSVFAKNTKEILNRSIPNAESKQKVYLQIGSFQHKSNAEELANRVVKLSKYSTKITQHKNQAGSLFKVRLGPFPNENDATQISQKLSQLSLKPVIVTE